MYAGRVYSICILEKYTLWVYWKSIQYMYPGKVYISYMYTEKVCSICILGKYIVYIYTGKVYSIWILGKYNVYVYWKSIQYIYTKKVYVYWKTILYMNTWKVYSICILGKYTVAHASETSNDALFDSKSSNIHQAGLSS